MVIFEAQKTRTNTLKSRRTHLWGAVKVKCYADKPATIDTLKDNIRKAIVEIQLNTIDNVLKNWTGRVGYCMTSRGGHLNEIICPY